MSPAPGTNATPTSTTITAAAATSSARGPYDLPARAGGRRRVAPLAPASPTSRRRGIEVDRRQREIQRPAAQIGACALLGDGWQLVAQRRAGQPPNRGLVFRRRSGCVARRNIPPPQTRRVGDRTKSGAVGRMRATPRPSIGGGPGRLPRRGIRLPGRAAAWGSRPARLHAANISTPHNRAGWATMRNTAPGRRCRARRELATFDSSRR